MDGTNRFRTFVDVVKKLRNPEGGCPWDLEQDHRSLRPYLIEETYEVLEAIDAGDDAELLSELGDVLLQVVLHAQVAADRGAFTIDDVVAAITQKMIVRHPHVFGDTSVSTSSEVLVNWEQIKIRERVKKDAAHSVLDGVPQDMPALVRAQRVGEKAARVGFDWNAKREVWGKVLEEVRELEETLPSLEAGGEPDNKGNPNNTQLEWELGDLFFALAQFARWAGVSAEDSLRSAIRRFTERFQHMERNSGRPLSELNDRELDDAWTRAKAEAK